MELIRHSAFTHQYEALGHTLVKDAPQGDALLVNFTAPAVQARRLIDYLIGSDYRGLDSLVFWGGDCRLGFPRDVTLQDVAAPLACGLRNVVIAHPGFSARGLSDQVYFYSQGGARPPGFVHRIQHALNVAVKTEWEAAVWAVLTDPQTHDLPADENPLQPLYCQGAGQAWQLRTADDQWLAVLRRAIPLARKEP